MLPWDFCVDFPNQTKLLVPRQRGTGHYIFPGLWEFHDMAFVMHFLRPDDFFLDVGANIGAYTVLASGVVGARTRAYEPSPVSYSALVRNVRLNNLGDKVTLRNVALGRERGSLRLTEGLGMENYIVSGSAVSKGRTTEVQVVTLDEDLAGACPTLLKIDVEGFEAEVFASGRKTLANAGLQALVMEYNQTIARYGSEVKQLDEMIGSAGFQPCQYEPFKRTLVPVPSAKRGEVSNLVYVRNLDAVSERLRRAKPFEMGGNRV
jgi:FkbM family methyltransferase